MRREASLEYLDKRLHKASKLLEGCAELIRDLDLNKHENIRRIGEALMRIFDVQREIYQERPDLTPDNLKEPPQGGNQMPKGRG